MGRGRRVLGDELAVDKVDIMIARYEPLNLLFDRGNVDVEPGLEVDDAHPSTMVMKLQTNF